MSIPDNSAYISRQVAPAGSASEVLLRVEAVCVNHEVTIRQVAENEALRHTLDSVPNAQ